MFRVLGERERPAGEGAFSFCRRTALDACCCERLLRRSRRCSRAWLNGAGGVGENDCGKEESAPRSHQVVPGRRNSRAAEWDRVCKESWTSSPAAAPSPPPSLDLPPSTLHSPRPAPGTTRREQSRPTPHSQRGPSASPLLPRSSVARQQAPSGQVLHPSARA